MAQPKVRQGPQTAQGRVPDRKATGRGEQENSPTAASSARYLLLRNLNHSRLRCPQGTTGANLLCCYCSQNLHVNTTEVNWGLQQRCSQRYDVTSGKSRTAASCLGSGTQAKPKECFSLELLLSSWSSHGHSTLSTELAPRTPAELWHWPRAASRPKPPGHHPCKHICSPAHFPTTF